MSSTSATSGALRTAAVGGGGSLSRRRARDAHLDGPPNRPEVLGTTASTGDGCPSCSRPRPTRTPREGLGEARRAIALSQIRGVLPSGLSDRLREPALAPVAASVVDEVAEHGSSYAAADRCWSHRQGRAISGERGEATASRHAALIALFVSRWLSSPRAGSCFRSRRASRTGRSNSGLASGRDGAFSIARVVFRPVVGWASDRFAGGAHAAWRLVDCRCVHRPLFATTLPSFSVRSCMVWQAFFFVAAIAAVSDLAPKRTRLGHQRRVAVGLPRTRRRAFLARHLAATDRVGWIVAAATTALRLSPCSSRKRRRQCWPRPPPESGPRGRLSIRPACCRLLIYGAWGMAGFLHRAAPRHKPAGWRRYPLAMYAFIVFGAHRVRPAA